MLTKERLSEILSYDPGTGIFTRLVKTGRNTIIGTAVGSPDKDGYLICSLDNKKYRMHRLVFLLEDGIFPKDSVDHINGNPGDNRRDNLRKATQKQNLHNMRIKGSSLTGIKNVHLDKRYNKYCVKLRIDGVRRSFGYYENLELAALVANEARSKYHGEYARHF